MGRAKVRAIQLEKGHFDGSIALPKWMEGAAKPTDFDGTVGKIEIKATGTHWLANVGDWFIFYDPGFVCCRAAMFDKQFELIDE